MKLFPTLNEISIGHPAGSGKVGGELRLFFTRFNRNDFRFTPPDQFFWQVDSAKPDVYTLTNGEIISVGLLLSTQGGPGSLFVFGPITVTLPGIPSFPVQPMGKSISPYLPEIRADNVQTGKWSADSSGKHLDVGFELKVPWDGTSADCHGRWWARWQ
jgi:hypothetical protein